MAMARSMRIVMGSGWSWDSITESSSRAPTHERSLGYMPCGFKEAYMPVLDVVMTVVKCLRATS